MPGQGFERHLQSLWCSVNISKWKMTHQALTAAAAGHQALTEAVSADGVTLGAVAHSTTGVTLAGWGSETNGGIKSGCTACSLQSSLCQTRLYSRWQPLRLSLLSPKNPDLHLSQRGPSTWSLQRHCPAIMPWVGSSCPSQIPPFKEPSGSQSQAGEQEHGGYNQGQTETITQTDTITNAESG